METYLLLQAIFATMARTEQLDGVDHLVIPVVALKEGVLNGLFYPAAEIKQFASSWNGAPITINHPILNGKDASANLPIFESTINVGRVFNARYEADGLKGEAWINIEKAKRLGYESIIQHLQEGKMMEVSTGLNALIAQTPGTYNNVAYTAIIKSIRPDHLAFLPNETGACSIEDGCGAMRNNVKEIPCACHKCTGTTETLPVKVNADTKTEDGFINKIATKIIEITESLKTNKKDMKMNKDQIIAALIANAKTHWAEADKATLVAMDVAVLNKMIPMEDKTPAAPTDVKPADVAPVTVANSSFTEEDRALFDEMKAEKVQGIANKRAAVEKAHTELTKEDVANLPMAILNKMAGNIHPVPDYSGAGGALTSNTETKVYKRPDILFNQTGTSVEIAAKIANGNKPITAPETK